MRSVVSVTSPSSPRGTPDWAEKVLERRRKLGLTQRELANAAGLTQQAVSYIERGGGVPKVTSMVRIARALGTTVESLFPVECAPLADGEPSHQVPPACLSGPPRGPPGHLGALGAIGRGAARPTGGGSPGLSG